MGVDVTHLADAHMPMVNQITLPQDILERVARVLEYHDSTKHTQESVRAQPVQVDAANQPYEFRVFEQMPKVPLPAGLLDISVATIDLMTSGLEAVPPSQVGPPQDLKTLATWLHFANGIASKRRTVTQMLFARTCASDGNTFPGELYVAAFAIEGLESGLYHYSPREFALRKLRDGAETLSRLTRGRPDLAFLKTVPAAILASSIFCRSTWRFGKRGYRHALHDIGYLVQNLVTVATGIGIQTITRLHVNDSSTRELIGIPVDADFAQAEAVQAMVTWADRATCPMERPAAAAAPIVTATAGAGAKSDLDGFTVSGPTIQPLAAPGASPASAAAKAAPSLPLIDRSDLANEVTPYMSIIALHIDCTAPGVALRELRSPSTDLSAIPPNAATITSPPLEPMSGYPLRRVLLSRQASTSFGPRGITRDQFVTINRAAFRSGTFFPLHPEGPHVALVRPFWFIHDVAGMDAGIWYYNPVNDRWSTLHHGAVKREAYHLTLEQQPFAHCAAACILVANVRYLMSVAGPDIYRLAHLEAGIVTNRLALSSEALDLAWFESGQLYDDEARNFLGLQTSGWEVICAVAIGSRAAGDRVVEKSFGPGAAGLDWRD